MKYDENIIVMFARRLYRKADFIVMIYILMYGAFGMLAGLATNNNAIGLNTLATVAVFGALGYVMGSDKAFQLRLMAQTALCQVQIEKNTRIYSKLVTSSENNREAVLAQRSIVGYEQETNRENESVEEILSSLEGKGYKVSSKGSGWKIREPLGGTLRIDSIDELCEYAKGNGKG